MDTWQIVCPRMRWVLIGLCINTHGPRIAIVLITSKEGLAKLHMRLVAIVVGLARRECHRVALKDPVRSNWFGRSIEVLTSGCIVDRRQSRKERKMKHADTGGSDR
jgi:hypothetical protein